MGGTEADGACPVETRGGLDFGVVDTSSSKGQVSPESDQLRRLRLPRPGVPRKQPPVAVDGDARGVTDCATVRAGGAGMVSTIPAELRA